MRVSVSLSDRLPAPDWRHSAACRGMDPRDFDESGTPDAWAACASCKVRAECRTDIELSDDKPTGMYQAGVTWGERGPVKNMAEVRARQLRWLEMHRAGQSFVQIAAQYGVDHSTVWQAVNKLKRLRAAP